MKYLTIVNYGYGDEEEVIEADSIEKAEAEAYQIWLEGAESQGTYYAEELTKEVAVEHGFEDEL